MRKEQLKKYLEWLREQEEINEKEYQKSMKEYREYGTWKAYKEGKSMAFSEAADTLLELMEQGKCT